MNDQELSGGSSTGLKNPVAEQLWDKHQLAHRLNVPVSWVEKHGADIPGLVPLHKHRRWDAAKVERFIADGGCYRPSPGR